MTSICEPTAEYVVVVAVVVLSTSILTVVVLAVVVAIVLSIVVLAIVVLAIVVLAIVVAIVLSIVIIWGITAASTVVGSPTKQIVEEPFISSILPLFCLSPFPASVTGA